MLDSEEESWELYEYESSSNESFDMVVAAKGVDA